MTEIVPSLIAQGAGGLVLGLACILLCCFRPRRYFIWWTLAGVCFALWLLLRGVLLSGAATELEPRAPLVWLRRAAAVVGWWHLLAWTLGLLDYRRMQAPPVLPALSPPLRLPLCLASLLATGSVAVLLDPILPWPVYCAVLSGAQAGLFAVSAAFFALVARQTSRPGALLPAVFLGAFAIDRVVEIVFLPEYGADGLLSPALLALSLGTFLLQTATTAGLIVLLLDEEKVALRNALIQLAESENRFRLVFEHSGVGMALLSGEGAILKANPALVRFLGYLPEELHQRRLSDLIHPADTTTTRRRRTPGGREDDSSLYEREKRFVHRSGEVVWARMLRVPVQDADGKLRYHVGVLVDITEQKRAEMGLAASETRYRLRFEHALEGIFLWDESGKLTDVNPAFCRMLGWSRAELLGRTLARVTPDVEAFAAVCRQVMDQGGGLTEVLLLRRGGVPVEVEMSLTVPGPDGKPSEQGWLEEGQRLFTASCRDITDRKRAEEALREERDFSSRILDTADALILVLDRDGCIERFNSKCAAVSGFCEEELRGRPVWELTPPAQVEAVREQLRLLTRAVSPPEDALGTRPGTVEWTWQTRDGAQRLVAWRYATVRDALGQVRHVIGAGLDITDERRLEEQLRQAQKMELLGTLVGGLAHDFNNHLTAINGNLDAVLEDWDEGLPALAVDEVRQHLTNARRAGQLCAAMTQGLLDFSRRRSGQRTVVHLDRVVAEALALLRNGLPKTIAIETTSPSDLWPVSADPTQIHQVVMNLAVNARDAMPRGGVLTVRLTNRILTEDDCRDWVEARPGRFVELQVEDTGTGMTPEVLGRIFEPFFTTKEVGQGTGLGLPMVFGIVKSHRGWLRVRSEVGKGSTIQICLPAAEVVPQAVGIASPPVADHEASSSGRVPAGNRVAPRRQVLLVDDEDLVRDLARSVLERGGFQVLPARDGPEALELYRQNLRPNGGSDIDVVLLDYTMPWMTGLQVLEGLQRLNPDVRVIFSSGYALDGDVGPLLESGARAFVAKPYRPQDLVAAVRAAAEA